MEDLSSRRAIAECVPTRPPPAVLNAMAREHVYKRATMTIKIASIKIAGDASKADDFCSSYCQAPQVPNADGRVLQIRNDLAPSEI
jgi:hypothetical protein